MSDFQIPETPVDANEIGLGECPFPAASDRMHYLSHGYLDLHPLSLTTTQDVAVSYIYDDALLE